MRSFLALFVFLIAGCSTVGRGVPTEQRIDAAMKEAAAKSAQNEAVNQALLPPLVVEMPKSEATTSEPRFDIAVNSAPASEVFAAIASGSKWSIVVHPSIKETIALQLKNVTVFEALDTVREIYGYEYAVHGNRILIQPVGLQTRVYQLNYLMSQREGRSETRVSSGAIVDGESSGGSSSSSSSSSGSSSNAKALESSRIVTKSTNDFWADVTSAVKGIVGSEAGRSVIVNSQAGVLVVRAMPSELRSVNDFLRTMQKVVARQVMLEAKIIEVQLRDGAESGINWSAFATGGRRFAGGVISPGTSLTGSGSISAFTAHSADGGNVGSSQLTATTATPGSLVLGSSASGSLLGLAFQTKTFAALLNFLETQGDLHVLSSPRIATINNQKAVLKVGTDEFFVTGVTNNQTSPSVGAVQNSPTITVQPFFSGIALDVTPQIDETGHIILHVHPSVSTVVEKAKNIDLGTSGSFKLPLAASSISESDTVVRVVDGNIVAIGGLMKESVSRQRSGVPGLKDLPIAGNLFKSRSETTVKSELVILIKPTIILGDEDWKKDGRSTAQRVGELQNTTGSGHLRRSD